MRSWLKLSIAIALLAVGLAWVFVSALARTRVLYRDVESLRSRPATERVRVAGTVATGSVAREGEDRVLRFRVADASGTLPVRFAGTVPDMFREDREVIVEGRLGGDGVFEADSILTKCPSKYEGAAAPHATAPAGAASPGGV